MKFISSNHIFNKKKTKHNASVRRIWFHKNILLEYMLDRDVVFQNYWTWIKKCDE